MKIYCCSTGVEALGMIIKDQTRPACRQNVFFLPVVHMNCSCGQSSQVCLFAFRRSSARTLRRCLVVLTHLADCFDHATILTLFL